MTVLEMCFKAGTGHVTSCFSCVEIMVALFYEVLKPEDVFIMSKGQASPLYYAILADKGMIDEEELWKFATKDGRLGVHLDHNIPGVVVTAGSLGHGLGIGAGMALVKKLDGEKGNVYCLMGDGECYEGSVWEAAMFAAHHKLSNLHAIVDQNGLCVTDWLENIVSFKPSWFDKWRSFGWGVNLADGHNLGSVERCLKDTRDFPIITLAETVKGKGIPFMENKIEWHGVAPQGEDAERARRELDGN